MVQDNYLFNAVHVNLFLVIELEKVRRPFMSRISFVDLMECLVEMGLG